MFLTVWKQRSDTPVPLFGPLKNTPKRQKLHKVEECIFLFYFIIFFLEGFCQCQPPLVYLLWWFHTYSIEPPPLSFLFTFLRGIGIPMEMVSSTTLSTAETLQLILRYEKTNMPNTTNAYVIFLFFVFYATAIQRKRQSLLPHYSFNRYKVIGSFVTFGFKLLT